jgi:hypothetical protein
VEKKDPPRVFRVGRDATIGIRDSGDIHLDENEQVSFVTEDGRRYDVVRKAWGFYATPSVNRRLRDEGFRTAVVRNRQGQVYVMVVEAAKQDLFERYCEQEDQTVVEWLDGVRPGREC